MENLATNPGLVILTVVGGLMLAFVWATPKEIAEIYKRVKNDPVYWRKFAQNHLPITDKKGTLLPQGLIVGKQGPLIGAAGIGKTAFWLYPCIEYAFACGMSFLSTDTKCDILRNY